MSDTLLVLSLWSAASCCVVGMFVWADTRNAKAAARTNAMARLARPLYRSTAYPDGTRSGERSAEFDAVVSHYVKHDRRMAYLTNEELLLRSDAAFERLRASAGMSEQDEVAA